MTPNSHAPFPPTRWSMVLATRSGGDPTAGRRALGDLCAIYWRPIYSFARRSGCSPADAEDLTQGFFAQLLKDELFSKADAGAGKLRSFLLGAFQRHQRGEWRKRQAEKRGAGREDFSLDAPVEGAEDAFQMEIADAAAVSPEASFERACALALLEACVKRLAEEQAAIGKAEAFEHLRPCLSPAGGDSAEDHKALAAKLGLTEEASRAAVYRLRKRFREILRDVVADTLEKPSDQAIDEELLALRAALS